MIADVPPKLWKPAIIRAGEPWQREAHKKLEALGIPFRVRLAVISELSRLKGECPSVMHPALSDLQKYAGIEHASILPGIGGFITSPVQTIDPNIKMLFHFDGSNGSTTFTDSSSYAKTWSTTGSPSLSTAQFKFGTASLRLNGSSVVSRASDTDLSLTGDFAIDVQCRLDSLSGFPIPIDTGTGGFLVYLGASSVVVSSGGADQITSASSIITTNTWFHLMVSRVGTSVRLFVDGTQRGSTWTKSGTLSNNQVSLGADVSGGSKCTGYFDEFRFLNGAGVSSNFTAPTAPY